jgi:hypothetical protein
MPTISQLPPATTVTNTDLFADVQGSVTTKVTAAQLLVFLTTGLIITESQVTGLTTSLASKLTAANNLSDLTDVVAAIANLGLGTAATINIPVTPVNGGTGISDPAIYTIPIAQGASNFTFLGPLTNGQLLIGSTGANPIPGAIIAGTGMTVTDGPGTITLSTNGTGIGWTDVTSSPQTMVSNTNYVSDNASGVVFTLPVTSSFGDIINVAGRQSGWTIAQNAGQKIILGAGATTAGIGGSLSSSNKADCVEMVCTLANTEWTVKASIGNPNAV